MLTAIKLPQPVPVLRTAMATATAVNPLGSPLPVPLHPGFLLVATVDLVAVAVSLRLTLECAR